MVSGPHFQVSSAAFTALLSSSKDLAHSGRDLPAASPPSVYAALPLEMVFSCSYKLASRSSALEDRGEVPRNRTVTQHAPVLACSQPQHVSTQVTMGLQHLC